jgi:leukotriene-A4 hydrolase
MKQLFLIISLLVGLQSCQQPASEQQAATAEAPAVIDPHSYARPDQAIVEHLDLRLEVSFENEVLQGIARLYIDQDGKTDTLFLDTKDLTITSVQRSDGGDKLQQTAYSLGKADDILGAPLAIQITPETEFVEVVYVTNPKAEALQWLGPQLTAGKKHPFLLSQSQSIFARTWVPIQDSPGIRFTYEAEVKVPAELLAVMSASNPIAKNAEGVYQFEMSQPIPAYLLALAVGDLEFAPVGERTGVYADPVILQKAADEFVDMEKMLELAEGLYGPYRWDRYDVIVLPPSFPFGGMENPRLTFATPTILAGDRSLISLIAHEMAHSWSGNLVTNATWNDFWLNEGFTVYFEYRIMEALKGRDYSEMLARLSYQDLQEEVADLGDQSRDTYLKLDLKGRHPDDGMSSIAYDKGYYLLRLIEETVGREKFDRFLKEYFTENAFKTMETETFLQRLDEELLAENPEWKGKIQLEKWVYGPGIPENIPLGTPKRFEQVEAALASWQAGTPAKELNTAAWSTHEWLHFLRKLPKDVSVEQLAELDAAFQLTQSTNSEIQCAWYQQTIRAGYEAAYPAIKDFLTSVGRRKFLTPLYRAMKESGELERAKEIYAVARPGYHPISYNTIDKLLRE